MIKISLVHAVCFVWLGKFVTTSKNWQHVSRKLFEYELIVVDSGILYIADENNKYEVHEGEYILMRPCEKQHGYQTSECSFHWLHFVYNEEFNQLEGDFILIPEHGKLKDLKRVVKTLSDIYYVWQKYSDRHYASYLTSSLLLEIVNQTVSDKDKTEYNVTDGKQENLRGGLCRKIEAYLKWNCNITTKVSDVAEYLGYSEKYISNVFRKEMNVSIRQYLAEQIVEQAKESLLNSEYTISEIAYSLGFSDAQNFSRNFKKVSGITPTEFRNRFLVVYEK